MQMQMHANKRQKVFVLVNLPLLHSSHLPQIIFIQTQILIVYLISGIHSSQLNFKLIKTNEDCITFDTFERDNNKKKRAKSTQFNQ